MGYLREIQFGVLLLTTSLLLGIVVAVLEAKGFCGVAKKTPV